MAASRAPPLQRSVMSEPRVNAVPRYNFTQPMDDFLFNLIGGEKEDSKPNNYYNWKPSSTFAEQPSAVVRNKKSKNKEREQNVSGKADAQGAAMMSNGPSRRRTPATYPRTQHVSSVLDREELEHLRQQLTYSDVDDQSTDSQALGSVSIANRVNNTRLGDDTSSVESGMRRPPSILDTIFVNEKPDRNKIVARLMQIRDYVKQANAMMSTLQNSMDNPEKDDQVAKLNRLQEHLQEQERGYLALLERMLAEELSLAGSVSGIESSVTSNDLNGMEAAAVNGGRSSQNSGESFATSVAESASINLDARSDISEATTEGTFTARTRPRIESHLGNHSCASDNDISDSELDDIRSVSSQATGSFGMDTQELHEQYSSMLQKYQDGNEENVSAAMERINLSRNEGQDDSKSSQMSSNSSYSLLEGQETKQNVSEQIATLEGLRKQHDLLRKMLKQQEELRTLQNRQAALMTLQSQIEGRLTNSEQEKAEETVSVTSTQATTTTATSVTEDPTPVTTTAGPPGRFATGVPLTAEDLQERRRTLMLMLAEQRDTRSEEIQQARAMDWMEHTEVSPPLVSAEHEELRDKLEALQQKKRQMDELLLQLHALHPEMPNIGGDTSSVASTTSNANEYSGLMVPFEEPNETSDENEATLTNGTDSLRKLHDVKERLTELRDLVQQYQDTSQLLGDQDEDLYRKQQMQQLGLGANYEDPVLMSNLRRLERGEPVGRPVQMRPNHMSYGGDGAYVQVGSGQTTSTVTETETETETESNHSSILAAWGDDPEIKEKVRRETQSPSSSCPSNRNGYSRASSSSEEWAVEDCKRLTPQSSHERLRDTRSPSSAHLQCIRNGYQSDVSSGVSSVATSKPKQTCQRAKSLPSVTHTSSLKQIRATPGSLGYKGPSGENKQFPPPSEALTKQSGSLEYKHDKGPSGENEQLPPPSGTHSKRSEVLEKVSAHSINHRLIENRVTLLEYKMDFVLHRLKALDALETSVEYLTAKIEQLTSERSTIQEPSKGNPKGLPEAAKNQTSSMDLKKPSMLVQSTPDQGVCCHGNEKPGPFEPKTLLNESVFNTSELNQGNDLGSEEWVRP
nr:pericentriolar material 1 protein-like [Lytechinus pictus]